MKTIYAYCAVAKPRLLAGASLGVFALAIAPAAHAQVAGAQASDIQQSTSAAATAGDQGAATTNTANDIIVTGMRASLQSAQNIKENAAQVVDSIVAEDIGKLPDRNIAEALQRISGIQIQRNFGEGSSVAIRGLTQVRTELNGRDIFTASGTTNALSLEDVPSELLAGIDVYKNPSADLIEGQLSGTINFRTRKPFDFSGFKIAASATNTYYDLVRKSQPSGSLLISDRWNTGIGEIGVLASVSYQKTNFRQDTISTEPFYTLDQSVNADGTPVSASDAATAAALGRTGQLTTLPHGTGIGEVIGDRRRLGIDVSLQWRPTDTLEFTGEYFHNDYKLRDYGYSYFAYTSGAAITPLAGAPFTFAPNGDFQSGTFTNVPIGDNTSIGTRHSITSDYSLQWPVEAVLQLYPDRRCSVRRFENQQPELDRRAQRYGDHADPGHFGQHPFVPDRLRQRDRQPGHLQQRLYLDDLNYCKGTDKSARLDGEYRFDGGSISSIKAGFRYCQPREPHQRHRLSLHWPDRSGERSAPTLT